MFFPPRDLAEQLARESPVVVMGRGHSGTRVMAWALAALGIRMGTLEEKATGDAQDRRFTRTIKRIAMRYVSRPPLEAPDERDVRRFRKASWRYLQWLGDTDPAWGWKFPETYLIGNLVDVVFPSARYIHLVRDGRDLAFKHHLTDDAKHGLGKRILVHLDALELPHHLRAARSWQYQVERFGEVEKSLGDRACRVQFERLCEKPVETLEGICGFLGMEMNARCRDHLLANVQPRKVSQFRSEDPALVAEVERAIGPTLVSCGYRALDEVDPTRMEGDGPGGPRRIH